MGELDDLCSGQEKLPSERVVLDGFKGISIPFSLSGTLN